MTENRRFQNSYLVSVFLHILIAMAWWITAKNATQSEVKDQNKYTWITLEPPKLAPTDTSKNQRVVETALVQKSEKAARDAFLGEQTQIVEKQTQSAHNKGHASVAPSAIKPAHQAVAKPDAQQKINLSSLAPKILPQAQTNDAQKNWADSGDQSPTEYIKGFEQANRTALNTKEFVYYGYFKRIKERLDVVWGELLHEQIDRVYRMGRKIASDMDHTTRLIVVMDPKGEITKVQRVEPSGTTDLDDTAVKAFNNAGPFPNPPKGIVEADGFIRIRWDFVLKT